MKMKRTLRLGHTVALSFVLVLTGLMLGASVVSSQHAAAPQSTGDGSVTSTIANSVNGYAMQIQSDGVGAYTNTKYVQSIINLGDWVMHTDSSTLSTRNVWLDFTKRVPGA